MAHAVPRAFAGCFALRAALPLAGAAPARAVPATSATSFPAPSENRRIAGGGAAGDLHPGAPEPVPALAGSATDAQPGVPMMLS